MPAIAVRSSAAPRLPCIGAGPHGNRSPFVDACIQGAVRADLHKRRTSEVRIVAILS